MTQISEIMNDVIDNFEILKLTIETSNGCNIMYSFYPVSFRIEDEVLYIRDDEKKDIAINCKDIEFRKNIIIVRGSDYIITLGWSL